MNSSMIGILVAGLAGLTLGGAYYAALWWTVRRSACARRPFVWLIGSYLLRAALLAGGILLVGMRDWTHLTACLIGLLAARVFACRLAGVPSKGEPSPCN